MERMWNLREIWTFGKLYTASKPTAAEDPSEIFYDALEDIFIDGQPDILLEGGDVDKGVYAIEEDATLSPSLQKIEALKEPVSSLKMKTFQVITNWGAKA